MNRKYNTAWESEHKWLTLKDGLMFCKLCNCSISIFKKHNLIMHEKTAKHIKNNKSIKSCSSLAQLFPKKQTNIELQNFDIKFSVAVACHCSISTVDHLCEIIKYYGKGSELQNLKLHRTKCCALIKNVVSVALHNTLVNE